MYEYIVGKHSDRDNLFYTTNSGRGFDNTVTLLLVSYQMHQEALYVLYEQNTFIVELDCCTPHFDVPECPRGCSCTYKQDSNYNIKAIPNTCPQGYSNGNRGDAQYYQAYNETATPYKWDGPRIVNLCLWVTDADPDRYQWSMYHIQWTALPFFTSLRALRLFILTPWDQPAPSGPAHIMRITDGGRTMKGTVDYRRMMRNLIALIPKHVKVNFGTNDQELQGYFCEIEYSIDDLSRFVPAWFLEKTFDEFKALRDIDVEDSMEDVAN